MRAFRQAHLHTARNQPLMMRCVDRSSSTTTLSTTRADTHTRTHTDDQRRSVVYKCVNTKHFRRTGPDGNVDNERAHAASFFWGLVCVCLYAHRVDCARELCLLVLCHCHTTVLVRTTACVAVLCVRVCVCCAFVCTLRLTRRCGHPPAVIAIFRATRRCLTVYSL